MPSPSYPMVTTRVPGEPGIVADANQAHTNINDLNDRTPPLDYRDRRGSGSPEGVVTAPVGVRYTDTVAATGAVEWTKMSGTGNTGWAVAVGDTGWRSFDANTALVATWVSGQVRFRRTPGWVHIKLVGAVLSAGTGFGYLFNAARPIPTEFVPTNERFKGDVGLDNNGLTFQHISGIGSELFWAGADHQFANTSVPTRPTVGLVGEFSVRCDRSWPLTLSGNPS